jgi:biotin synthase-like enzyme
MPMFKELPVIDGKTIELGETVVHVAAKCEVCGKESTSTKTLFKSKAGNIGWKYNGSDIPLCSIEFRTIGKFKSVCKPCRSDLIKKQAEVNNEVIKRQKIEAQARIIERAKLQWFKSESAQVPSGVIEIIMGREWVKVICDKSVHMIKDTVFETNAPINWAKSQKQNGPVRREID